MILNSFNKHTGLDFKQSKITIRIRKDGRSKAGNKHQPMELSVKWVDENSIGCTLIHELAHRLVIGNGIELPEGTPHQDSHYNYFVHRHIYLFLYDVFVDVLGKEIAEAEVQRESADQGAYAKAWRWALAMSYRDRQNSFERLKKRYKLPLKTEFNIK
jgi:hypothetical protein